MEEIASIESVASVISLAVAPVFLLAGIAGLLAVMSTRLGRITDRARVIERRIPLAKSAEHEKLINEEADSLWARTYLINWSIRLCVCGALMICFVIMALFIGEFVEFNIAVAVAVFFVTAILFIISGLLLFLREVGIATVRMRLGIETALSTDAPDWHADEK